MNLQIRQSKKAMNMVPAAMKPSTATWLSSGEWQDIINLRTSTKAEYKLTSRKAEYEHNKCHGEGEDERALGVIAKGIERDRSGEDVQALWVSQLVFRCAVTTRRSSP